MLKIGVPLLGAVRVLKESSFVIFFIISILALYIYFYLYANNRSLSWHLLQLKVSWQCKAPQSFDNIRQLCISLYGQHFATRLHLFCFHAIRIINVIFCSIKCHFSHFFSYAFVQRYVRISPSDMNDFSLRDLPTFYLPL